MDEKTLEALKGSIKKWEGIVAGTEVNKGAKNCPLCLIFNTPTDSRNTQCIGCPVMEHTTLKWCRGTPYEGFETIDSDPINNEDAMEKAKEEVLFLKSLLPPTE